MVALEKRAVIPGPHVVAPLAAEEPAAGDDAVVYPDSDGEPLSDNTLQLAWIVLLYANLDAICPWFVAADLLWYPVEGKPKIRLAPDVLVALERPKGYRGSYMQFREDGVPPTVVFEILSPSNTVAQMSAKSAFYLSYGAREFIVIDPDEGTGWAVVRNDDGDNEVVEEIDGWVSPALGVRFSREDGELRVYRPDGTRFKDLGDAEAETAAARSRAEQEARRAEQEALRAERLAARLAALGVDPDEI